MIKSLLVLLASMFELAPTGAATVESRFSVALPAALAENAGGRLLVFVEPATSANSSTERVDVGDPENDNVSVAAVEVREFGPERTTTIDTKALAAPTSFASLAPGEYRVQVVLDRDSNYSYAGRGAGDLVSKVQTVRFPLTSSPLISLDHVVPPAPPSSM